MRILRGAGLFLAISMIVAQGTPPPRVEAAEAPTGPQTRSSAPPVRPPKLTPREVTFAEYRRCVAARRCSRPEGRQSPRLPVVGVTRDQAAAYCAFVGSRLPTDAEWSATAAAAGARFPWGDDEHAGSSNCIFRESGYAMRPPGSERKDEIAGLYDLHANALEWTADGTVRGAFYCHEPLGTSQPLPLGGRSLVVGFRCITPPPPADALAANVRSRIPPRPGPVECHPIVSPCGCADRCGVGRSSSREGLWRVVSAAQDILSDGASLEHWCFDEAGRGHPADLSPPHPKRCLDVFHDPPACEGECAPTTAFLACHAVGDRCVP